LRRGRFWRMGDYAAKSAVSIGEIVAAMAIISV
jgi:hypothetical protein